MNDKDDIIAKVNLLLDERIRPILQQDGGDVIFHELDDEDNLMVELIGACDGCPHAQTTLQQVIGDTIRHFIPEIKTITDISQD